LPVTGEFRSVRRSFALGIVALGAVAAVAGTLVSTTGVLVDWPDVVGYPAALVVGRALLVLAVGRCCTGRTASPWAC
jgi:hypothetical protein